LQSNNYTAWRTECLIKNKNDIELISKYVTYPKCDVEQVNREAEEYGEKGIVRGFFPFFDIYGQPGCWQDACCLAGVETMIMACYDDPDWVHSFLKILLHRKMEYINSTKGAKYDLIVLEERKMDIETMVSNAMKAAKVLKL
jgi:hypothetical protein